MSQPAAQTRIDRWLAAARVFKSRSLAQEACEAGHVRINDAHAKPSQLVKIGDEVRAFGPRGQLVLQVKGLADKRLSAPLAQLFGTIDGSGPTAPARCDVPTGCSSVPDLGSWGCRDLRELSQENG